MPRGLEHYNYTKAEIDIVRNNWKSMSDESLAKMLNCIPLRVQKMRLKYNISRYHFSLKDNSTKAYICELFIADKPLKEIAGIVGKSHRSVSEVVSIYFGKPLTENTVIIVKQSIINEN